MSEDPEAPIPGEDETESKPALSYRTAMLAYAVLGGVCLGTLTGDALYIALLIIGALALKTWLARAKSRLEQ